MIYCLVGILLSVSTIGVAEPFKENIFRFAVNGGLSEAEQANRIAPIFGRQAGILVDKFMDCSSLMADCGSRILVINTHNKIGKKLGFIPIYDAVLRPERRQGAFSSFKRLIREENSVPVGFRSLGIGATEPLFLSQQRIAGVFEFRKGQFIKGRHVENWGMAYVLETSLKTKVYSFWDNHVLRSLHAAEVPSRHRYATFSVRWNDVNDLYPRSILQISLNPHFSELIFHRTPLQQCCEKLAYSNHDDGAGKPNHPLLSRFKSVPNVFYIISDFILAYGLCVYSHWRIWLKWRRDRLRFRTVIFGIGSYIIAGLFILHGLSVTQRLFDKQ
jgi:hypothetical protein